MTLPKYDRRNRSETCPSCGISKWSAAQSKDGLCDECAGRNKIKGSGGATRKGARAAGSAGLIHPTP
jgi:hypothetical protein